MDQVTRTVNLLRAVRCDLSNEKAVQRDLHAVLQTADLFYKREHRFDSKNIVDFFLDGVAIEVKINKNSVKAIYKQCERYCQFDEVKALILVTNRAMGFPEELNGKPCYVVSLGRGWL